QVLADSGAALECALDVGCGSGILAIAFAKRWPAARCAAVDIDPLAVAATDENARANGVAERIAAGTELVAGEFPLVLANIQAHVLRELRAELLARVAPGGTLILSGLLTPQAPPLAQEFAPLRVVR